MERARESIEASFRLQVLTQTVTPNSRRLYFFPLYLVYESVPLYQVEVAEKLCCTL
jgi:hypothetical protein